MAVLAQTEYLRKFSGGSGVTQVDHTLSTTLTDLAKSFLFSSWAAGQLGPAYELNRVQLLNTTTIAWNRQTANAGSVGNSFYVCEFLSGVSVQRGSVDLTSLSGGTSEDITLSLIDLDKSFISYLGWSVDTTTLDDTCHWMAYLWDDAGTIKLHIEGGVAPSAGTLQWEVVEYEGCSVQRNSSDLSMSSGTTSVTDAISAVDLDKSFLHFSYYTNLGDDDPDQCAVRGKFNSTTQVGFDRGDATNYAISGLRYEVVEFTDGTTITEYLHHHDSTDSSSDVSSTLSPSLTAVNKAAAFVSGFNTSGKTTANDTNRLGDAHAEARLTSTTNLSTTTYVRFRSEDTDVAVYVIDFAGTLDGVGATYLRMAPLLPMTAGGSLH